MLVRTRIVSEMLDVRTRIVSEMLDTSVRKDGIKNIF